MPPQHVAEQVFELDEVPAHGGEPPAANSRIAGRSRIAFRIPSSIPSVPLQLGPLLEILATCELQVVDAALPRSDDPSPPGCLLGWVPLLAGPDPALRAPTEAETAVELPFRLILSPTRGEGFVHRPLPVVGGGGRIELWHSQLGMAPGSLGRAGDEDRSVRAIWLRSGDDQPPFAADEPVPTPAPVDDPFPATLNNNDRHQIVHLSANFKARRASRPVAIYPKAIGVSRLALSSLGATLDSRGEWKPPTGMSLEEWIHRAALGRDHYVRLVNVGWLYPIMHRARFVRIFERQFDGGESHAALIRVRYFVVPHERVRHYRPGTAPTPQLGRTMPLRRVHVRTGTTPDLDKPANLRAFEIRDLGGAPVPFHLQGADADDGGNVIDFRMPLWFVAQDAITSDIDLAVAGFGQKRVVLDGDGTHKTGGVPLDIVAVDPAEKPAGSGDSTWLVRAISWRGQRTPPGPGDVPQAPFYPIASSMELRIPAVETVAATDAATTVTFHSRYVEHGLDGGQNPGAVVASMTAIPMSFAGKGDRSGGLVRPELSLTGLSRKLGPVAGSKVDDIASGAFNPSDFFGGALPTLFGTLPLDRLIAATGLGDAAKSLAPKLLTTPNGGATFDWTPQLRNYPATDSIFVVNPATKFTLHVSASGKAGGSASEIRCTLEDFGIHLVPGFECVEIDFEKAEFVIKSGKPDVDVRIKQDGVRFVGALSFVETLTSIIPLDGFSDPPALDVTPSGARASFSLSLPSLTLGIFSLENISFGAGFLIPFDQRSMLVSFNFCQRHEPFLLTVSALGGGGFFLIEVDAAGVQRLEAALEFGASLSMNFGVASGGVHVMAGIYFAYETAKGASLTGYVRVGGNVTALGIVSVSIELYLALAYEFSSGKAVGVATLTIEIEIFLFSASVEIRCEKKFAGSASDPTFREVMSPYLPTEPGVGSPAVGFQLQAGEWPWERYWAAYA
jgi:hypothetical protein